MATKAKKGGRSRSRARGHKTATGRAASRRPKRQPPAGFGSWGAFMASIRPTLTAPASNKGASMARKRKSRSRSRAVVRRSASRGASATAAAPRRRRRSVRGAIARFRPTRAGARSVIPFTINATIGAAEVLGGMFVARKVRGFTKLEVGSPLAMLVEFVAGIGAGLAVSTFSPAIGERVAIGGVLAPMLSGVQRLKIAGVSDTLADDGFILDGGVTMDDGSGVAGYVTGANGGLAGYVPGRDYVNG